MLYRITILFVMMIFCVGSLPLITHGQRGGQSLLQEGRRLALSTKRVDHPDGRTIDSLSGRHQKGDKTINLSAFVVKKGIKSHRSGPRSQNPASNALFSKVSRTNSRSMFLASPQDQNPEMVRDPYDPGYDYYYSYSEMARPDGAVIANASYEYQASTNQNTLSITVSGVTLTFDLNTEEAAPLSDADQEQLQAWGASEDANIVRDTSIAIIDEGSQQSPSQLLLNYYAIALFVDTTPATASGPRPDSSPKSSLHHAVSKLSTPIEPVSARCSERMITPVVAVGTSVDFGRSLRLARTSHYSVLAVAALVAIVLATDMAPRFTERHVPITTLASDRMVVTLEVPEPARESSPKLLSTLGGGIPTGVHTSITGKEIVRGPMLHLSRYRGGHACEDD